MKRKKMTLTEELNQMSRLFAAMGHKVVLKEATTGPGGPGKSTALTALDGTTALAKYIGAETVAEMEQSLLTAARNSDAIVQKLGGKTDFSFDDLTSAGFGSTKSEIGESIIKNLEKQAAENLSTTLANYIGTKNKTESSVLMTKNALSNDVKLSIKSLSDNLDVLDVAAMSLIPTTITKLRNLSDDITETTLQTQLRDLLDGAEAQVNTKKLPDVSEGGGTTIKDIDYDNPLVTKDNLKNIVSALLDPTEGLPALKRKVQIAEIGGAAAIQGLKSGTKYEEYAVEKLRDANPEYVTLAHYDNWYIRFATPRQHGRGLKIADDDYRKRLAKRLGQKNNSYSGPMTPGSLVGMGLDYFGNRVLGPAINKASGDISEIPNIGKSGKGTAFGAIALGSLLNPGDKGAKGSKFAIEHINKRYLLWCRLLRGHKREHRHFLEQRGPHL